jgi:predicted ATP-dependent endonuclease of OLD family
MEISLVAEGLRKIGTLTYLAANGSLKSLLFWDEAEVDLNAKILTQLASSLIELVETYKMQVILATHSFFLMKELSVRVEISKGNIPAQFISLVPRETQLEQGGLLEELATMTVLDEILAQDNRVQQLFYEGQL